MLQIVIPATLRIKGNEVERGVFYYGDRDSVFHNPDCNVFYGPNCKDVSMYCREVRQIRKNNKKIRPRLACGSITNRNHYAV